MGRRGPPPTPTALRVLHGETRPSRINANEPKPALGTPRPPRWLAKSARPFWRELVKQLEPMHVLTLADQSTLALMADALAEIEAANRLIEERGLVVPGRSFELEKRDQSSSEDDADWRHVGGVRNPAIMIKNHAFARFRSLAVQFGLTPSARVGLDALPGGAQGGTVESLFS